MFRIALIVAAAGLLAACTNSLERLQGMEPTGTPFTQALAKEYQAFAEYEAYEMYDWIDQQYFADKGLRAASGEVVPPESVDDWDIPAADVGTLKDGRNRLVGALDNGGRENHPEEAARAQAKFDCWVEQQEENHQPDHIEACETEFEEALAELSAAMAPEPEPEPEPTAEPAPEPEMAPSTFLVFFDFDSTEIKEGARAIIELAAEKLPEYDDGSISIVGHTDTSGSNAYNQDLSERRADAVRAVLRDMGVSAGQISTDARGESDPLVETGDGVRSPQNRRAAITVK